MKHWQNKYGEVVSCMMDSYDPNFDRYYVSGPYTEVIVTPKPQPKIYKKRIALFNHNSSPNSFPMLGESPFNKAWVRVTDFVEVEFKERTDELDSSG